MTKRKIFITANDLRRLQELLGVAGTFKYQDRNDLKTLESELSRAKVVDSRKVPENVVTMNTRLKLRFLDDDSEMEVTLVFPADADIDAGRLSVFSPIGTAVLGYAEGDLIEWDVPAGKRSVRIEKILYQPEASGHYHL